MRQLNQMYLKMHHLLAVPDITQHSSISFWLFQYFAVLYLVDRVVNYCEALL